jgi:enoyl-CoA hydratase
MGIARQIAENSPLAVEVSKQIARCQLPSGSDWDHHDALAVRALKSADAVEGATAFAERRPPVWQGG